MVNDTRPVEGWAVNGTRLTFTRHDAGYMDDAPEREGFVAHFIVVGPGSYTTWFYKPVVEA